MVDHLYQAPDVPESQQTLGGTVYHYSKFTVDAGEWSVTQLAWYRISTSGPKPTKLVLTDADGGARLAEAIIVDNGAVGWQFTNIQPFQLTPGRVYAVGAEYPVGCVLCWNNAAITPTGVLNYVNHTFGNGSMPVAVTGTTDNTPVGLDVSVEAAQEGDYPPAVGPSDVTGALAAWLDPATATLPEGNAGAYPDAIIGLDTKINRDGITLDAKIGPLQTYFGVTNQGVSAGLAVIAPKVQTILDAVGDDTLQAILNAQAAALATLQDEHTSIVGLIAQLSADLAAVQAAVDGLVGGVASFPTGWTLLDETEWATEIAWAQPAHLYVCTITAYPAGASRREIGDIVWLPRAAWWAPLNGTQPGTRRFCEFNTQQLHVEGALMPGILLASHPGWSGTLQAWQAP